jgi:N-acetylmuramoyl-L-alanine amidase
MTPVRTSSTNARGEGAGAGAYPGNRFDAKNMLLAYQLQKAITEKAGAEDRGVKRARFQVLREAEMPAVLIEAGFMTSSADAKRIYDPAPRRQLAQAIVDGVLAYKRLVERQ